MTAYIPLATITLGSNQQTVTFSNIPTSVNGVNLRDLVLVFNGALTGNDTFRMRLNGDTGANYDNVEARAQSGNTTVAEGLTGRTSFYLGFLSSGRNDVVTQIFDFSATNKHKAALTRYGNAGADYVGMVATGWVNTAAVNSVLVRPDQSTSIAAGGTISLYGIAG